MLELWADLQSPYHKYVFSTDRKLILFCASGMRSALATKTLKDMGMTNVCLLYTSPSPRDRQKSRMPSSA